MKNIKAIVILVILLCSTTELFAQDWIGTSTKNKWGEIDGYAYGQITTGVAHGDTDISVSIGFAYSTTEAQLQNAFFIYVKQQVL
jgi:hypothetical protein